MQNQEENEEDQSCQNHSQPKRELQLTGNQGTTHQRRVHPHQEIKLMTQRKEVKGWKNIHCQRRISITKEAAVNICREAT